MAKDDMARILARHFRQGMTPEESMVETNQFWSDIDSFLIATSNISKVFWPARQKKDEPDEDYRRRETRGKDLRRILAVGDDSPFLPTNRAIRNQFEHYDEELDEWFFGKPRSNMLVDSVITYSYQYEIERSILPADYFRIFLQDKWILHSRGEEFSFDEMADSVQRLLANLRANPPTTDRDEQFEPRAET
jgi:hypothetical protein